MEVRYDNVFKTKERYIGIFILFAALLLLLSKLLQNIHLYLGVKILQMLIIQS